MNLSFESNDSRNTTIAYGAGLFLLAVMIKIFVFQPISTIERVQSELAGGIASQTELRNKLIGMVATIQPPQQKAQALQNTGGVGGFYQMFEATSAAHITFTTIAVGAGKSGDREKTQEGIPFEATFEGDFASVMKYFMLMAERKSRVKVIELEVEAADDSTRQLVCKIRGYLIA